jgi:hypothetical protein
MKKLLFTIAGILLTVNGFGQGYVQFQNAVTSKFFVLNYASGTTNAATSGAIGLQDGVSGSTGTIDVGLYWSTSPFTESSQGTLAGVENIGTTPGILAGNSSFAIAGTNPGDTVYIQILMWDGTFSTPNDDLLAGYDFGASSAGTAGFNTAYGTVGPALQVTLGLPGIYATPIFGTAASEFGKTYLLNGAPEPASVVTGGLGAAVLLLLRRRQRVGRVKG